MRLHHRGRVVAFRLFLIFVTTFGGAFLLLNLRFVEKNVQYWVAPGTIRSRDTLGDAVRLFPLSADVAAAPLPDDARLVIDKIGVDAPIVFEPLPDLKRIYARLEDGVVNYGSSAKPGNPGTAVILGHSSAYPWYKGEYGAVFALLSKLALGDRFYVQYADNRLFVYEVSESVVFNPFKNDARLTELEAMQGDSVILISCYPVGTDYLRIAVRAVRVQI
jgi:LPXTG-site transpeptidase (sortase) family protein